MENIEKTIDEIDRIKDTIQLDIKNEIVIDAIFDSMHAYGNLIGVQIDDYKILDLIKLLYPHRYKLRVEEIREAQSKAIEDAEKDGVKAIIGKIGGNV